MIVVRCSILVSFICLFGVNRARVPRVLLACTKPQGKWPTLPRSCSNTTQLRGIPPALPGNHPPIPYPCYKRPEVSAFSKRTSSCSRKNSPATYKYQALHKYTTIMQHSTTLHSTSTQGLSHENGHTPWKEKGGKEIEHDEKKAPLNASIQSPYYACTSTCTFSLLAGRLIPLACISLWPAKWAKWEHWSFPSLRQRAVSEK